MNRPAVVIIGHGSRREESNQRFVELVEAYQARHPELDVSYGYIELAKPDMSEALSAAARQSDEVIVLPMQLFHALHVKNDIPLAIREAEAEFPAVRFIAADALGVHPKLAELACKRACETGVLPCKQSEDVAVVVVGRGSSDPGANSDFFKQVRLIAEGKNLRWVLPSYIAMTEPRVDNVLDLVARTRPKKLLVLPYLLLTGVLIERLRDKVAEFTKTYPWVNAVVAEPLGMDELLFEVFDERLEQTVNGREPLPCVTCKYRIELPEQEEHVGGLKSLLWSQRHRFTHTQAMPADHAHKAMKKHVLVCGNVDCAERGSIRLLAALRASLKEKGLRKQIEVTRTACMGRCGEGPTVAIYPDGVWYRGVQAEDVEELVEKHLLGDNLVARLVDDIM